LAQEEVTEVAFPPGFGRLGTGQSKALPCRYRSYEWLADPAPARRRVVALRKPDKAFPSRLSVRRVVDMFTNQKGKACSPVVFGRTPAEASGRMYDPPFSVTTCELGELCETIALYLKSRVAIDDSCVMDDGKTPASQLLDKSR
jgi:hypothetical protein